MKTIQKTIAILSIIILIFSCSKDDEPTPTPIAVVYPEENPLPIFLTTTGFNQQILEGTSSANSESGFSFRPMVKGKINALVIKSHRINIIRVTIWNKLTETVLRTELVDVSAANTEIIKIITPLELEINKEYVITMNNKYWSDRSRTDSGVITYPITAGNISITGSRIIVDGLNQTFPSQALLTSYKGDCSFIFQQTASFTN